MKKIEAIVRPEKYEEVKDALDAIDVKGITVSQVLGCGHQKGHTERIRGVDVEITMLNKIKFEIVVSTDEWAEKTIDVIKKVACTGNVGDGKIFVYDIEDVVRIRTGERGIKAV
jgi:nitrogen regulatory protein P-II 1